MGGDFGELRLGRDGPELDPPESTNPATGMSAYRQVKYPKKLRRGRVKLFSPDSRLQEGRWPRGRVDVSEPGGPGFDSSSRQPQVVAHQH